MNDDTKSTQSNPRVGPADYRHEKLIGNKKIAQSGIKACPQFSFSKSLTHRTVDQTNPETNS